MSKNKKVRILDLISKIVGRAETYFSNEEYMDAFKLLLMIEYINERIINTWESGESSLIQRKCKEIEEVILDKYPYEIRYMFLEIVKQYSIIDSSFGKTLLKILSDE